MYICSIRNEFLPFFFFFFECIVNSTNKVITKRISNHGIPFRENSSWKINEEAKNNNLINVKYKYYIGFKYI